MPTNLIVRLLLGDILTRAERAGMHILPWAHEFAATIRPRTPRA